MRTRTALMTMLIAALPVSGAFAAGEAAQPETQTEAALRSVFGKIGFSGELAGTLQAGMNTHPKRRLDASGLALLGASYSFDDTTKVFASMEAVGGSGIDRGTRTFSTINRLAGSTGDSLRIREAWVSRSLFDTKLVVTAGKLDMSRYFDRNEVANNERSQFLTGAFDNGSTTGLPDNGPALVASYSLMGGLELKAGVSSTDTTADDLLGHAYIAAGADYRAKPKGLDGTYRIFGFIDHSQPDGLAKLRDGSAPGLGISIDQKVSEAVTAFMRFSVRDARTYKSNLSWSIGGQYRGIAGRDSDVAGVAYGYTNVAGSSTGEKALEAYYRIDMGRYMNVSPHAQVIFDPLGNSASRDAVVLGLRTQLHFQ